MERHDYKMRAHTHTHVTAEDTRDNEHIHMCEKSVRYNELIELY